MSSGIVPRSNQRSDLRRALSSVAGSSAFACAAAVEDRLGEMVLAHKAAICPSGDMEAGRHGQARRCQTCERRALAADPFERGIRAVQFEYQRF